MHRWNETQNGYCIYAAGKLEFVLQSSSQWPIQRRALWWPPPNHYANVGIVVSNRGVFWSEEAETMLFIYFVRVNLMRFFSNLHYICGITPKRVTGGRIHLRDLAPGQHSSEDTLQRCRNAGGSKIEARPPARIVMCFTTPSTDRSILPWFVNEMLWTAPCSWALHLFCEVVANIQRQWRSLPSQPIRWCHVFPCLLWNLLPTKDLIKKSQLFLALDENVKRSFLSEKFPLLKVLKIHNAIEFCAKWRLQFDFAQTEV